MRDDTPWSPYAPPPEDDPWGAPPDPRTRRDGPPYGQPNGGNVPPPDGGWGPPPRPSGTPSRPNGPPPYPPQRPEYPPMGQPNYPPQGPGQPPSRPNYPPQGPSYPPQRPPYPPQTPEYPPPGFDDDSYGRPQRPPMPPQRADLPDWASPTPSRPRPNQPSDGYRPPPRAMSGGAMGGAAYPQDRAAPLSDRYGEAPARWDRPAVHDLETDRVAAARPMRERAPAEHARRGRGGWSLPIEHIVLAAGVLGMYLALSQPWGKDPQGNLVFLSGITRQAALYATLGLTGLGGALILLNKRMGCFALIGCLGLFVVPLLVAATVGGFTVLTQLHVIPQIALSNVQATNRGFFLWWGGLAVTLAGLALQIITHRRKGLIGI